MICVVCRIEDDDDFAQAYVNFIDVRFDYSSQRNAGYLIVVCSLRVGIQVKSFDDLGPLLCELDFLGISQLPIETHLCGGGNPQWTIAEIGSTCCCQRKQLIEFHFCQQHFA